MYRSIAYVLALGLLAGCAGQSAQTTTTESLAGACNSYANALDQLTPLRAAHKLDAATVAKVDTANSFVDPLCRPGVAPVNLAAAVSVVAGEASAILNIVQGVHP